MSICCARIAVLRSHAPALYMAFLVMIGQSAVWFLGTWPGLAGGACVGLYMGWTRSGNGLRSVCDVARF
jgi:hypothetical protein